MLEFEFNTRQKVDTLCMITVEVFASTMEVVIELQVGNQPTIDSILTTNIERYDWGKCLIALGGMC